MGRDPRRAVGVVSVVGVDGEEQIGIDGVRERRPLDLLAARPARPGEHDAHAMGGEAALDAMRQVEREV